MGQIAPNFYRHLSTNTVVTISRAGVLADVSINTKGAGGNTLTLQDGSDTIAVIDTSVGIGTLIYDKKLLNGQGLTITMATGSPADVTVGWAP